MGCAPGSAAHHHPLRTGKPIAMTVTPLSNVHSSRPRDLVLRVAGEIDLQVAPALRARLARAAAVSPRTLVLDLSEVTFISCAGLRALYEVRAELGERLWLRAPSRPVTRLLELIGVQSDFRILAADGSMPDPVQPRHPTNAVVGEETSSLPTTRTPDSWRRPRAATVRFACIGPGTGTVSP